MARILAGREVVARMVHLIEALNQLRLECRGEYRDARLDVRFNSYDRATAFLLRAFAYVGEERGMLFPIPALRFREDDGIAVTWEKETLVVNATVTANLRGPVTYECRDTRYADPLLSGHGYTDDLNPLFDWITEHMGE